MKRVLLIMACLLAASSVGWAGACPATSLSNYVQGGGYQCSVGPLLFTFSPNAATVYSSSANGPATAPTIAQVTVQPFSLGAESGLEFTAGWVSLAGGSDTATINFTVSCPGCNITDAALLLGGSGLNGGTAGATETATNLSLTTSAPNNLSAAANLLASSLSATTTLATTGGNGNGHISGIFDLYSVPEPAALALLGTALIGAGLILRRRLTG